MMKPEIEEFAQLLVKYVRDQSIKSCDRYLQANNNTVLARRWRDGQATGECNAALQSVIADCVDETIFYLLNAIDQELMQLKFSSAEGNTVDLVSDGCGELSGWYMGSDGWRSRYSSERYIDDFSDLSSTS